MRVSSTEAMPTPCRVADTRNSAGRGILIAEKEVFVLVNRARDAAKLVKLSEVASERTPDTVERVLAAAKEELGMEVAFVSEFAEQRMIFRKLVGEAESFGWQEGESIPLDDTYCRLLIEGRLPSVIPDANGNEWVEPLDVTGEAGIGSYVGAPIKFSDGQLYGTLCALSHSPDPSLKARDAQFMRVLARLVAEHLERERNLVHKATARARAHELRRIGRELHDRVAHTMAVIHQSLQLYEVYRERDPEVAAEKMELAKRMSKEAMSKTKDLSRALNANEGGQELKAALSELLQDIVPPGMDHELSVVGEEALVSDEVREQLFLVLREALRNTVSHSGASKVTTTVVVDQAKIAGVVEDNGQGFDRKTTDPAESGGLAYMADRASLLDGACSVDSSPGGGTRAKASFPLYGALFSTR
jgi:signal transduction histidine kinase